MLIGLIHLHMCTSVVYCEIKFAYDLLLMHVVNKNVALTESVFFFFVSHLIIFIEYAGVSLHIGNLNINICVGIFFFTI